MTVIQLYLKNMNRYTELVNKSRLLRKFAQKHGWNIIEEIVIKMACFKF